MLTPSKVFKNTVVLAPDCEPEKLKVELGEGSRYCLPHGTRRVWPDSKGRLWVSEWNAGNVSVFDPEAKSWRTWPLPAAGARCYSVYVDERDKVWLTDFTSNAIVVFDPETESFESFPSNRPNARVRQMLGRKGEAWGAESGTDRLVVIRFGKPVN